MAMGTYFPTVETCKEVERPHIRLYTIYEDIFNLLSGKQKDSFLTRLIGRHYKERQERLALAWAHFQEPQKISDINVLEIAALERDIRTLSSPGNSGRWVRVVIEFNRYVKCLNMLRSFEYG